MAWLELTTFKRRPLFKTSRAKNALGDLFGRKPEKGRACFRVGQTRPNLVSPPLLCLSVPKKKLLFRSTTVLFLLVLGVFPRVCWMFSRQPKSNVQSQSACCVPFSLSRHFALTTGCKLGSCLQKLPQLRGRNRARHQAMRLVGGVRFAQDCARHSAACALAASASSPDSGQALPVIHLWGRESSLPSISHTV